MHPVYVTVELLRQHLIQHLMGKVYNECAEVADRCFVMGSIWFTSNARYGCLHGDRSR